MPITPEEYQMTIEEMLGGASGQSAYQSRISGLRGQPEQQAYTPATSPTGQPMPYTRGYGETEEQFRQRIAGLGNQPVGSLYGLEPEQESYLESIKYDPTGYNLQLSTIQEQINALDRVAAQERARITAQYQKIGASRQGSLRAMQAGSGMLGQIGGAAQQEELQRANIEEQEAAITEGTATYEQQKRALMGDIRAIAIEDLKARREAATLGAEKFLEFKTQRKTDIANKLQNAIRARIMTGLELNPADFDAYARELGITRQEVSDIYTQLKQEYDVEAEKLDREAKMYGLDVALKEATLEEKSLAIEEKRRELEETQIDNRLYITDPDNPNASLPNPNYGKSLGKEKLNKEERAYLNSIQDNARQDPDIKIFNSIKGSYQQAQSAYNKKTGAGDIVLMRTIAKMTDPTSSVREEEFQTFKGAQATLKRFGVAISKQWWKGDQLSDYGRDQLFEIVKDIYNDRLSSYLDSWDFYDQQAIDFGLASGLVLPRQDKTVKSNLPQGMKLGDITYKLQPDGTYE